MTSDNRLTFTWQRGLLVLLSSLALAACGGGEGGGTVAEAQPSGAATLDAAGGTVRGVDGAQVVVPPGALASSATVRIAKDATDMPALPPHVEAVGDAWSLTPHGAVFQEPVQVMLPRPARALREDELLRVAKVSPGGTWELLTPEASAETLSLNVLGFSHFVPVAERYQRAVQGLPPLELRLTELLCNNSACQQIVPDSTMVTLTVASNGGYLPSGCVNPQLRVVSTTGTITDTNPLAYGPANGAAVDYSFRFRLTTSSPRDITGWRNASSGELSVQLMCFGPPESRTPMVTAPVRFPAVRIGTGSNGIPGQIVESAPDLGMAVASLSCNGGPCSELTGPQDVRLSVRLTAGNLPYGCALPARIGVKRSAEQPVLAESEPVPAAGSPLSTPGGVFAVGDRAGNLGDRFRVNPPVPARAQVLFFGLLCANGTGANGGHVVLNFVTPQQQTAPAFVTMPRSQAVLAGLRASFTAVVTGFPAPALQWQTRGADSEPWIDLSGATGGTYTTDPTTLDDNGRQFRVVASNSLGSVDSPVAQLSVNTLPQWPVVITQPASLGVRAGSDAAFAVQAGGTGPLSYQWQFNGTPITGANGTQLKLTAVGPGQAGRYRVVVSNAAGTATSAEATLEVSPGTPAAVAPTIVTPPAAVTVNAGNTATFAVGVAGTAPYTYQWLKDGQPIEGANAAYYSLLAAGASNVGSYAVRVSNAAGSVTSTAATLSVVDAPAPVAVSITTQPSPQVQLPGGSVTFAVAASGTGPLAYQWLKDGTPIGGATGAVLVLAGVTGSDAASYAVTVSNGLGSVTSSGAALTVVGAPAITAQPAARSVSAGGTATFSVAATGSSLGYQWTRDGVAISGATAASYTTPVLGVADSGSDYAVIVYNGAGVAVSSPALLTVSAAPVASPAQARGKIAAAYLHTCAITAASAVACWGHNSSGQIGTGNVAARSTPYVWTLPEAAVSVSAGASGSCAVTASGNVWCSGSPLNSIVPKQLGGFAGVRQVAVGQMHTCVLASDATVWCWGANGAGMLGNGSTAPSATPVQVQAEFGGALTGVQTLQAGLTHTCATLDDYSTRCWGTNTSAQSGAGTAVETPRAHIVSGATYIDQLALGGRFSCGYSGESSAVLCWGLALDGSATTNPAPTSVFLYGPTAVGAGEAMACAIVTNGGEVACWGSGMMGNGNVNENQWTPALVSGLTGALAMAGGQGHSCVLRTGGSLVCWGSNSDYQIGTGDSVARTTPTEVSVAGGFWRP